MAENDFNAMQAQAIRYAREMQRRAMPQQQNAPSAFPSPPPPPQPEKEPPNRDFKSNKEPFSLFSPISNIINSNFGNILKDRDAVLILALVILLAGDGADKMLILALLYIIS